MVDDLAAATEFCAELGLVLQGEGTVEGRWVDRVVGLDGVRVDLAMMQTPDGDGRLELVKFHSPSNQGDNGHAPANTPGLRHLAFAAARTESSSSWRSGSANGSKSVADSQRLVGQSLLATLPTWGRTVDTTWQEEFTANGLERRRTPYASDCLSWSVDVRSDGIRVWVRAPGRLGPPAELLLRGAP